ncbi:hypothetical protein [Streptomyces sp. NPDC096030]|uniref:hypothetical protein n=1 Tax=Streptomyces sp. NPDC096030 TaxID=3155423 RepID=UPI00332FFA3B
MNGILPGLRCLHQTRGDSYTSTEGLKVGRVEADRVLPEAMADAGTKLIRRWLIWSAVTMWTMLEGKYCLIVLGILAIIAVGVAP